VAADVAADAVAEVFVEEAVDETSVVKQLAERRAAALQGLDPAVRRRRLYASLARRGYDADDVRRAVDAALGR
jgi:SOS response regulatory protein OraA/RecX